MADYRKQLTDTLSALGTRYHIVSEEDNIIHIGFKGERAVVELFIDFDEKPDGSSAPAVHFVEPQIAKANGDGINAMVLCNMLNCKYRWIKFRVDDSLNIGAEADAMLSDGSVDEECLAYIAKFVQIIDEAYPIIFAAVSD